MKKAGRVIGIAGPMLALLILLLDADTTLQGARAGVELCINSVIPSLFPFVVFSNLLSSNITGVPIRLLSYIGKLCKIPKGYESILIPAYLGGYPIGAQSINEAYRNKVIVKADAERLLAFCNNAGPSFIFGIGSILFDSSALLWFIWLIHILSSVIVGIIIPSKEQHNVINTGGSRISISQALTKGIRTMATICGWVILFRILATTVNTGALSTAPKIIGISVTGILELTNGCCDLTYFNSVHLRFLLFSCFISFGGICVTMQTVSVTKDVGVGLYFLGKFLQCTIAYFLTLLIGRFIFPADEQVAIPFYITLAFSMILIISLIFLKKSSNSFKNVV